MKNEKKRRKKHKIIFVIVTCITCFILLCNTCFAWTSEYKYNMNVFVGYNTYPIVNTRISILTHTNEKGYFYTDLPVDDYYDVRDSANYESIGSSLTPGSATGEYIYSNVASQALVNPSTMINNGGYKIEDLGSDFSRYYNDVSNGKYTNIDVARFLITKANTAPSYYSDRWLKGNIYFSDVWVTRDHLYGTTDTGIFKTSAYFPNLRGYIYTGGTSPNSRNFSMQGTIYGYDDIKGEYYEYYFDNNYSVNYSGAVGSRYVYTFYPYGKIRSIINDECPQFKNCDYIYVSGLTVYMGNKLVQFPTDDAQSFYERSFDELDVYIPCIRPFDSRIAENSNLSIYPRYDYEQYIRADINRNAIKLERDTSFLEGVSAFGNFIGSTTNGVLRMEILPSITLGGVLFTCIAIGFTFGILKYFAGG